MWDHPRSRGVYSPCDDFSLARSRIIPARAGFTLTPLRYPRTGRDHPRSRGVYATISFRPNFTVGSSPLARGLRTGRSRPQRATRIIPARAGFTEREGRRTMLSGDHPRSRGVYHSPVAGHDRGRGSSPLARGLLPGRVSALCSCGIIPARAGFTAGAGHYRR